MVPDNELYLGLPKNTPLTGIGNLKRWATNALKNVKQKRNWRGDDQN
jgi:hypothetical protein